MFVILASRLGTGVVTARIDRIDTEMTDQVAGTVEKLVILHATVPTR